MEAGNRMSTPNNWDETIDLILCVAANYGLIIPDDELEAFQQGFKHTKGFKEIKSALNKAVSEIVIEPDVEVSDAAKLHTIGLEGEEGFTKCNCGADYSATYKIIHNNELRAEQRKIIGDK